MEEIKPITELDRQVFTNDVKKLLVYLKINNQNELYYQSAKQISILYNHFKINIKNELKISETEIISLIVNKYMNYQGEFSVFYVSLSGNFYELYLRNEKGNFILHLRSDFIGLLYCEFRGLTKEKIIDLKRLTKNLNKL